jgi:uncharacterized DUF497 family protein
MDYEWDERKRSINFALHGVDFAEVESFDWESARVLEDDRKQYGEIRYIAIGYIQMRLYVLVFTIRENRVRVISLRKATRREVIRYEKN